MRVKTGDGEVIVKFRYEYLGHYPIGCKAEIFDTQHNTSTIGESRCHPKDQCQFSRATGRRLALVRAYEQQCEMFEGNWNKGRRMEFWNEILNQTRLS